MKRLFREPLVHFLLLGALLFALYSWVGNRDGARPGEIVVTAGTIEHLASGFARTWQRPPTRQELDGLVQEYIREEVFYREAVTMGLDRDDTMVRRRLRQKLEFLADDAAALAAPTDDQLRAYLVEHAVAFRTEPGVAFRQVYINRDRRGARAAAEAARLLAVLSHGKGAWDISTLGDALMLPQEFELAPNREVIRTFGEEFARQLDAVPPGRWTGPIESGYGLHLVFVTQRIDGHVPELAEVREAVQRDWVSAHRKEVMEAYYSRLRQRYTVVVQQPEPAGIAPAAAATR